MIKFLILLTMIATCIYLIFTKTDFSAYEKARKKPPVKEIILDGNKMQDRAIERQRRINNGEY